MSNTHTRVHTWRVLSPKLYSEKVLGFDRSLAHLEVNSAVTPSQPPVYVPLCRE